MRFFFIGLFLGVLLGIVSTLNIPTEVEEPITVQYTVPVRLEQPEFFLEDTPSIESVLQACEYYNIKHSGIVVSQAILETGHFKSENCTKGNNLFGLFNSKTNEFFIFDHWTASVKAYRDKIQCRYSEGDYCQWLETIGYAEDTAYIQKIKNIQQKYGLQEYN